MLTAAMARVLFDGLVEYDDGTPATTSQMAKDVVQFLYVYFFVVMLTPGTLPLSPSTTSGRYVHPRYSDHQRAGFRAVILLSGLFALSVWAKRFKWSPIMNRKIVYDPPKGGKPHH